MRPAIAQVMLMMLVQCIPGEKLKRSPLQVGLVNFNDAVKYFNLTDSPIKDNPSHSHRWVPGHVRHHAFIPAHIDHVYIPIHALLISRTSVQEVLVSPQIYNPYRKHYGGFGIGVDNGGQGAGHGFHVLFND